MLMIRKFTFFLLLLCGGTQLAAQTGFSPNVVRDAEKVSPGSFSQVSLSAPMTRVTDEDSEPLVQSPKWLTNLPVDSAVFAQPLVAATAGSLMGHCTIYSQDLVKYFVGNTITAIKTYLPVGKADITLYVVDADTPEDTLYSAAVPNETERGVEVTLPCHVEITKAMNLLVGFNFYLLEDQTSDPMEYQYAYIVPCNRTCAWMMLEYYKGEYGLLDYTYMRRYLYGDPHLCYGYYFHCVTEGDAGLPEYDLKLDEAGHYHVFSDQNTSLDFGFTSYGVNSTPHFKFKCTYGNDVEYMEFNEPLQYLGYATVKGGNFSTSDACRKAYSVQVVEKGGEVVEDGAYIYGSVTHVDRMQSLQRNVLMEEFTGLWCGWCPRGARAMELLSEKYGDKFIPVAVHGYETEAYYSPEYAYVLQNFAGSGFPSATLNRLSTSDPYYGTGSADFGVVKDIEDVIWRRPTEADVQISDLEWDEERQVLTVESTTTFHINSDYCPYGLAYALTEDGLKNIQTNYYPIMYGSSPEDLPEDLRDLASYPSSWVTDINHVARAIRDADGMEGSLGETVQANVPVTHVYEFHRPDNVVNMANTHIIVMVVDRESKEIINAVQLPTRPVTGVKTLASESQRPVLQLVPGGLEVLAHGTAVNIYAADGKLIRQVKAQDSARITVPAGCYVVKAGNHVQKVCVR